MIGDGDFLENPRPQLEMTCPFCLFNFYFFHYRPSGIHFFHIFTNLYFFICTHSYIICLLSRQFLNYFLHSCTFRYSCCFYGFCKFLIFCILYLISACLFRLLFPCCCEALLTGFYRFKACSLRQNLKCLCISSFVIAFKCYFYSVLSDFLAI